MPSALEDPSPFSHAVEVLHSAYRALGKRDLRTLGELVDELVEVRWSSGRTGISTTGRHDLLNWLSRLINSTHGTAMAAPHDVYAAGDGRLIVVQHETAHWGGYEHDRMAGLLVGFSEGKIARIDHFHSAPLNVTPLQVK